jgi:serine/threonine-protein kinase
MTIRRSTLRARQRVGKYRIERLLAQGGFADVYRAQDTIEGIPVALKVPRADLLGSGGMDDIRREVRMTSRLEHPNVLHVKNADVIDGRFLIAYPLGEGTLDERLRKRLSTRAALDYGEQLLLALAYLHARRIMHCDVKPDNLVLFADDHLRITDFGIAKVALRTMQASGSGTLGYVAPEQAMGKPSLRSDVFAAGLVLWRMLAGTLPEWPYEWPLSGHEIVRRKAGVAMLAVLRRSLQVDHKKRFRDAGPMLDAFRRARAKTRPSNGARQAAAKKHWREVRLRQFRRAHGGALGTRHTCTHCAGPVSMEMRNCPWCGTSRAKHKGDVRLPARCPRCARGVKLDWRYCAWCHGAAIGPLSEREYTDRNYAGRCKSCRGDRLLPFSRYCPDCRAKVKRPWKIEATPDRCGACGWGVVREHWKQCPWCGKALHAR